MNDYFNSALESLEKSHIASKIEAHHTFREEVKVLIEKEYSGVYSPITSGSIKKKTEINTNFDFDLVVPFERDTFNTLGEMHKHLYNFLNRKYPNSVKMQTVSVGITKFYKGHIVNLDAVPGRELSPGDYKKSGKLNLNVKTEGVQSIQTNIQKQIAHIRNSPDQTRNIVRLLKNWKTTNGVKAKSFMLELFTIEALSANSVPSGLGNQLKTVLGYIRDNIETAQLIDPGNSNNDVLKSLTATQKTNLKFRINNMLKNFDNKYEIYFPGNAKFISGTSNRNSGYSSKSFG